MFPRFGAKEGTPNRSEENNGCTNTTNDVATSRATNELPSGLRMPPRQRVNERDDHGPVSESQCDDARRDYLTAAQVEEVLAKSL